MLEVFQVLGGLALFLFGVNTLSSGMEKLAGSKIQIYLDKATNKPVKGAIFGAAATALVQSSSLLMVTMIGLINANILTLPQAISVMLGQEIRTTITAQIAAFKIGDLCFLLLALGFILIEFNPKQKGKEYGEMLFGLGLIFLGLNLMSDALKVLTTIPAVTDWLIMMGQNIYLGIIAGTIATAIVQSSSAITGLVVAMGISQAISLPGAIAILLGANIGTCFTGFIASFRLSRAARQASIAQFLVNLIGVLIFLPFIPMFTEFVIRTSPNLPRQAANAHSLFNVLVSLLLFPFIKTISKLTKLIVPDEQATAKPRIATYIDLAQQKLPSIALAEAMRESLLMGEKTTQMLVKSKKYLSPASR
ncbi:MAG TPA: Na/Pi cotransporter family protein [Candidatus Wirthbacteria bacterium]|nr:Na/Pi cotransporter family protein [Candidatus Wirthbacteria bacterium]